MKLYIVRLNGEIKERLFEMNNSTLARLARQYGKRMVLQSVICL
ncbi:MAG: hypothetical protein VB050_08135 [Geobacteraceae bacterium]|nr:hypothetical protein [Geobacteraceae bacterium]